MKCEGCADTRSLFTIVPEISNDIGWASHLITDIDGYFKLYHYQCSNADLLAIYEMYNEMSGDKDLIRRRNPI